MYVIAGDYLFTVVKLLQLPNKYKHFNSIKSNLFTKMLGQAR